MGNFIVQATPPLVYHVTKNMRERDAQELLAVHFETDREQLANGMALLYGDRPFTFCLGKDDEPICIITGTLMHPGLWIFGMWATDSLPKIGKMLSKFAVTELFGAMRHVGARRVEVRSIVGYTEVHKWLRFLGFAQGETQKSFGKNGEDFILFYWHEGMPWPKGYDPTAEAPRSRLDNSEIKTE